MFKSCLEKKGENNTGRYVMRNGQLIKVSNDAKAHDIWFKEHKIDGDKDLREFYKHQEEKGLLNKVDDRVVWENLR